MRRRNLTPMDKAVERDDAEAVRRLLDEEPGLIGGPEHKRLSTLLWMAAGAGSPAVARLALESGAGRFVDAHTQQGTSSVDLLTCFLQAPFCSDDWKTALSRSFVGGRQTRQ